MEGNTVENYGPVHLHPNVYPLQNVQDMHMCGSGMYPCDDFPAGFSASAGEGQSCTPNGPQAISNSSNPAERYGLGGGDHSGNYEVGTGCMNLSCMAPNCHGAVKCPSCNSVEGFIGGAGFGLSDLVKYIAIGLIAYLVYCMITGKKLF